MTGPATTNPTPSNPPAFRFDRQLAFDPSMDFDAFVREAPAKWVVYLLSDGAARPVQLLCVKNLRYSLRRRLGPLAESSGTTSTGTISSGAASIGGTSTGATSSGAESISKRVDYRQIVRNVAWSRVDSAFEADVLYLEAARAYFPDSYQQMSGFRPAWFVHVDPEAPFPRYTRTTDLSARAADSPSAQLFGPLEDRNEAQGFIEDVQDWFDLCRYHHILVQAPAAVACAYKEMGKCPAPCDGSISMPQYRRLVELSMRAIVDPDELIRQHTERMQAAAKELRFETAAKIKAYIDSLGQIGAGPLRHLRRLRDFNFLTLQHGPRAGTAKAFLVTPGEIDPIAGLPLEPSRPSELMSLALSIAADRARDAVDAAGAERVGIVAHHLFQPKSQQGIFLPLDSIDEKQIARAYRDLQKQKKPATDDSESDSEGVVKELQAM